MKMQKLNIFVKVIVLSCAALCTLILQAEACKMSRDQKFNYFVNSSANYSGMFWEGRSTVFAPTVIEKCQQSVGQYLMLSLGVRVPTTMSETSDISFDGKIQQGICKVQDAPLPLQSFDEKKLIFEKNHKILRQCTHLQVYDLENRPIQFKPDQTACKIRSIGNGIFRLDGDFCFLKIGTANRFVVSVTVNDECKSEKFLKDNNIEAQDLEAALNAYTVGDDSGSSTEIDPLGSSRVRLYFQPKAGSIPLTDDEDTRSPRFPTVYAPDIHMGALKLQGSGQTWTMDMSLFVDNRTDNLCTNGQCHRVSNFNVPIVGEANLYSVRNGKRNLIDSWWHAGVATANWQGLLTGISKNINEVEFKVGDKYSIETIFIDPFEDYTLFAMSFQQFLIDLKSTEGTAGIDVIQSMKGLQNLAGLSPLRNLPNLTSGDFTAELDRVLLALSGLNKDRQWPAYYDKVCSPLLKSCVTPGKVKYFMKVRADFEIAGFDEMDGSAQFKNIKISRDSKVSNSYENEVKSFPKQSCGEL